MRPLMRTFFLMLFFASTSWALPLCKNLFRADEASFFSNTKNYLQFYRNQSINGRVFDYYDQKLQTRIYVANNALPGSDGTRPWVDPLSSAVVIFLHGSGTLRSSGKNFIHHMNTLASLNVSAISMDLPFHADGPLGNSFESPRYVTAWLNKIVEGARVKGIPIYFAGHSFGPSLAMQYMYDYPFGVNGALLISPVAFNSELRKWYNQETSRMNFGGSLQSIDATMGGVWGDMMLERFSSHLNPGVGDPTLINPELRIFAITGDREEYAEAPLGGRKKLPIGKNTYSIPKALEKMFSKIKTVLAEGVGHYIFKYSDEQGRNLVMRELLDLIGLSPEKEKQLNLEVQKLLATERPAEQRIWAKYHSDEIFKSWIDDQGLTRVVVQAFRKGKSSVALNILEDFRKANEARKKEIVVKLLQFTKDNGLEQRFSADIADLKQYGLRDCLLLEEFLRVSQ